MGQNKGLPMVACLCKQEIRQISELHPLGNKEYDYTVVFFGDNTK